MSERDETRLGAIGLVVGGLASVACLILVIVWPWHLSQAVMAAFIPFFGGLLIGIILTIAVLGCCIHSRGVADVFGVKRDA